MKSIKYERIGEIIYALIDMGEILELKIIRDFNQAIINQEYIARIKTIDMRISSAFIDIGEEIVLLPFNAPRPKYIVEGALIIVKINRSKIGDKLAIAKYIGDASNKYNKPMILKNANPWGDWETPIEANIEEINLIKDTIENISNNIIGLKNGGNISIENTRAMTTIDIDASSRIVGGSNQNNFNHKLNLEAAKEIIKQIRLRNISGLIAIDFVGAPSKLEGQALFDILKNELPLYGKCEILPISKFGVCEIARARIGASNIEILNSDKVKTIAINAINDLAEKLKTAKGNVLKLKINEAAYNFLNHWNIDWKNHIIEKIGGNYEIIPNNISTYEIL